jgi:signal transduction histidine kinase
LDGSASQMRLTVKDDGNGLARPADDPALSGHYGLLGMRERAGHIGAEFRIDSVPGRGTTVSVELPSHQPAAFASAASSQNGEREA